MDFNLNETFASIEIKNKIFEQKNSVNELNVKIINE